MVYNRLLTLLLAIVLAPLSLGFSSISVAQTSPLTTAQSNALEEAEQLHQQMLNLWQQGKVAEAIPLAERELSILERSLGNSHPYLGTILTDLVQLYYLQGDFAKAKPLIQRTIAVFGHLPDKKYYLDILYALPPVPGIPLPPIPSFTPSVPKPVRSLPPISTSTHPVYEPLQDEQGNACVAYAYAWRVIYSPIVVQQLPTQVTPSISKASLDRLVEQIKTLNTANYLYQKRLHSDVPQELANAVPMLQEVSLKEVIFLQESALGNNHPDVATSLSQLAEFYESKRNYVQAEPLRQRALKIRLEAFGEGYQVIPSLKELADLYQKQGKYRQAELFLQRAQATQQSYNHRFKLRTSCSSVGEADHLRRKADQLREEHGQFAAAISLVEQALQISERLLGSDHSYVIETIVQLANLHSLLGDFAEAERLYQRALKSYEQVGEDGSAAFTLNSLARLYQTQGNYIQAEASYQQALQLYGKTQSTRGASFAFALSELAQLYRIQGYSAEAEPLFRYALTIVEQGFKSTDTPYKAFILHNLGEISYSQGNHAQAEQFYQQALATLKRRYLSETTQAPRDKQDFNNASVFKDLALLHWLSNDLAGAYEFLNRAIDIEEINLKYNFSMSSEARKRAFAETLATTTSTAVSFHLQTAPNDPQTTLLAFNTLIQRKGRILDEVTEDLQRLRQNLSPQDQQRFDELSQIRTQLATLLYRGQTTHSLKDDKTQVAALQAKAEQLENTLIQYSAKFRNATQPVTIAAIQSMVPNDAALVELVYYYPFNSKAKMPNERWDKPRYAAYILSPQGAIQAVDLGEAAAIDQLVAKFRRLLQQPNLDPKPVARQLDALLMQPIRAKLGDIHRLLISPDSQLNLIPFAALIDEQNRYLVETYAITYLTSGRDLLRLKAPIASLQPPLILANPDYASPGDPTSLTRSQPVNPLTYSNQPSSIPSPTRNNSRSNDLTTLKVDPLPGTAEEVAAIAPKLPEAIVLTGSQATENALHQVQSPRILHIATHGFFLQDLPQPAPNKTRAGALPLLEGASTAAVIGLGENPLLRAGLALAGFNLRQSGNDDGVLTALEAANLNLRGTQLVVLSACETGLGDITNGEGVYGLRRAFTLAGAETQLISLWKVSDDGTKDLMVKYYDRLLQGSGRSDALLQTQREFLQDPQYRHPYYWASFISSGDWRSLR